MVITWRRKVSRAAMRPDLVGGVGQKRVELGAILALAVHVRWASPVGRRRPEAWWSPLQAAPRNGCEPGRQVWIESSRVLRRPRHQRFQARHLAIVHAEVVRRRSDELDHARQVIVATACGQRFDEEW